MIAIAAESIFAIGKLFRAAKGQKLGLELFPVARRVSYYITSGIWPIKIALNL